MIDNKLLIVDDDEDTCSNLTDILTEYGFTVDVAYRGQTALELLRRNNYQLALVDYRLPCMTGVDLFQQMRRIREDLKAVLVTGYATSETAGAALKAGMREIVSKPVDMPTLVSVIEKTLS